MDSTLARYLHGLTSESSILDERLDHCLAYWAPRSPPATIAFAEIGVALAAAVKTVPPDALARIGAQKQLKRVTRMLHLKM
jgi:hypothetical protein